MISPANVSPPPTHEPSQLYRELADLQADLSKTVAICHQLRSENDNLTQNNEKLKQEHIGLRGRYANLRRQCLAEAEAKIEVERKHEELCRTWQAQLEGKAQEFEELQAQLAPPRDLDMLRMKIQEELEGPHQHQLQALESEVEKYRELFFNIRREHELLKTEYEQFTIDSGKQSETVKEAAKAEINELRRQLMAAQESAEDNSAADSLRSLERSLSDGRVREGRLREELTLVIAARDDAVVARERLAVEHARERSDLQCAAQATAVEMAALRRNLDSALQRCEEMDTEQTALQERLAESSSQCRKLQFAADNAAAERERAVAAAEARVATAGKEGNRAREALITRMGELQKQLEEADRQRAAAATATEARVREAQAEASSAQAEVEALTARVGRQESSARAAAAGREREGADRDASELSLRQEVEALRQEVSRCERERQLAQSKGGQAEAALAALKRSMHKSGGGGAVDTELQREFEDLRGRYRELMERHSGLQTERDTAAMELQCSEQESAKLRADVAQLRTASDAAVAAVRQRATAVVAQAQREASAATAKAVADGDAAKAQLRSCKKKLQLCKSKFLQLHERHKKTKRRVDEERKRRLSVAESLQMELSSCRQRTQQLEREREMLLRGATGGGAAGGDAAAAGAAEDMTGSGSLQALLVQEQQHREEYGKCLEKLHALS